MHTILIPSKPCPYTSCNDGCIVHSNSAHTDPELVDGGGSWNCMLLLHSTPTCADAGPDLCTLHTDLCTLLSLQQLSVVVFLLQLAQVLDLRTWWFMQIYTNNVCIYICTVPHTVTKYVILCHSLCASVL